MVSEQQLRFDGRVAVVTGAGAGLGREYALLLAARGAKVVVNDLGGTTKGEGQSQQAADIVVEEIRAKGGIAVANYNSVVDGEKIIQTALDQFGRVDILINNAGILRDRSFARISDKDWDLVNDVHLKGSFKCTQAAWAVFKKQKYGRVVMTSSTSGLYGNFGQANYAAAKMGLVGLAKTIALEGANYNIHCNIIVPTAASRMTKDVLPEVVYNELKPSLIAPVVTYLCHESNEDNGAIIISAAGWATKTYLVQGYGSVLRTSLHELVTPEYVQTAWPRVTDMSRSKNCEDSTQALGNLMNVLEELKAEAAAAGGAAAIGEQPSSEFVFGAKDLILYALGIGATTTQPGDLRYLYENHADFAAIPTFFLMPGLLLQMTTPLVTGALPHTEVQLSKILHGEQYLEVFGPLPVDGRLLTRGRVIDVQDKRSGAVVITECESFDEAGTLLARNQSATFVVGAGNFGGKSTAAPEVRSAVAAPARKPDASVQLRTSADQAALYRLSGDLNPLHIDPDFAILGGQEVPILHGLCSLGFSVRAVLQAYAGGDAARFRAVKARFTKPVLPGQTLNVNLWRAAGEERVFFETSVLETGVSVISGAYVDLLPEISANRTNAAKMSLQSDAIFAAIKERVAADQAKAKSINAIFQYKITKNGTVAKDWTLDLKSGEVYEGAPQAGVKADTTLTVADSDMVDIALGKTNPQVAFMKGKLKITGNIMLTQKLVPLLKTEAKL